MFNYSRKVISLLVIFSMLFVFVPSVSYGESSSDRKINSVLVTMADDTTVSVTISKYVTAYIFEDELFDFLKDNEDKMKVYGIVSGNKYINISDYIKRYVENPDNVSQAIEESQSISKSEAKKIMVVNTNNIEDIKLEPIKITVEFIQKDATLQILAGVYAISMSHENVLDVFPDIKTNNILEVHLQSDIVELNYNENISKWVSNDIQGFSLEEINNAEVKISEKVVEPNKPITLESLNVSILQPLPGVYAVKVYKDNLTKVFPDIQNEDILLLTIKEKEYELKYYEGKELWASGDIQGFTEEEIKSGIVSIKSN